ncbi:hypothetical protein JTE90_009731 [Oedothorax gibbosus]|uniref:EF-hand domain-containing protein n=1 Tax=Oedothorax gibbosus TaxID=931172 RepID=A0AAV6VAD9_9ARAC|nr:hypothetical protein JTE90_009731 [Oedothorax gibbosus]
MDLVLLFILCVPFAQGRVGTGKKIIVDKEHLKHDFLSIFGTWATVFSDAEMDFRYFEAHDYDGNRKLDGLELFAALGHDSNHSHEDAGEEALVPEDIEKLVDDIFEDHDNNNDGFLSYKEFLNVERNYLDIGKD